LRTAGAVLGFAFAAAQIAALHVVPAAADAPKTISQADALRLLGAACGERTVAQASPSAAPSASGSPTPTPIPIPPIAPGPGTLLPPTPLPTGPPPVTPPPLPTPTPKVTPTSGPVYLVRPTGTPGPLLPAGASPTPAPSPTAPVALPTLGPGQFAVLGDELSGSTKEGVPSDYRGNVHIFYSEGTIVGDLAHYDGDHTVTISGNAYIINRNSDAILYADKISFDTKTSVATLTNGRGETTEGVETGKLHYSGRTLVVDANGKTHGEGGSFTTCENQRGGYHVDSKSMDVTPGDKLIAHKNTVFLGALGVFFLPVLIVPLKQTKDGRRQPSFVPEVGYDQADGFWVKARVGFGKDDYYYGYYRIEEFTKRGLGLGYVAYIGRRDNRRVVNVDFYTFNSRQDGTRSYNANVSDLENFSQRLRGQLNFVYTGDYGPNVFLPPSYSLGGSVVHTGSHSSENYQFSRSLTGSQSTSDNLAFIDQLELSPKLSQGFNISFTDYTSNYPGQLSSAVSTLHLQSLTHLFTKSADYTLTLDRTDSQQPFGYDREPELQIIPHFGFQSFRLPFQFTMTYGYYVEQQNRFATERADFALNVGPALFKVFRTSDFSAGFTVTQDLYGTGDEKANVTQNLALTTPLSPHIVNAVTYSEQNPIGPSDVPFQLLDRLSGGSHQAQDVLRIFNGDVYSLSLSTGTGFNRQAQPWLYQLTSRPSQRSTLILSGSWNPGAGNGFTTTNVQLFTPFGRETDLQFAANIDWKNKGRLEDKTIFYRKVIGECYDVLASYNEDLKAFNLNFELLAFPGRTGGIGISPNQPLIPTSFNY
jgi:hypothetical protein